MGLEQQILGWIEQDLSEGLEVFGGLPPCPYAKEAVLKNEIKIVVGNSEDIFELTEQELTNFGNNRQQMTIVATESFNEISLSAVKTFVEKMRHSYFRKDLWLLFDHPENQEFVGEQNLNNGNLLFMIQSLSVLVHKSRELQKTNYYDKWEKDYFDRVVGTREHFYSEMNISTNQAGGR